MYLVSAQVKFAFGDRVRFNSSVQGKSGTGTIYAVTIDAQGLHDYMIELDKFEDFNVQPGILEEEITLLEPDQA